MTTLKNITPTLTLAQLYEAQKQFLDAYAIYHKLYALNQSEEIKERMQNAEEKFFTNEAIVYATLINQIFSPEEKQKFRILPEQSYNGFQEAMNKELIQETEMVEEDIPDDIEAPIPAVEEIETPAEPTPEEIAASVETIEELLIEPLEDIEEPTIEPLDDIEELLITPSETFVEPPSEPEPIIPDLILIPPAPIPTKPKTTRKKALKHKDFMDISVLDLANYLKKNFNKDKMISDLTLAEVKKILNDLL